MKSAPQLRPIGSQDAEFLCDLYASTRDDIASLPWDAEQKRSFLRMQFEAQRIHYDTNYPDAHFNLVVVADRPIGCLYVDRRPEELHILEIALIPEFRGQGIGETLIRSVQREASSEGKSIKLSVLTDNFARRLYLRLGFRVEAQTGVYEIFRWRPSNTSVHGGRDCT